MAAGAELDLTLLFFNDKTGGYVDYVAHSHIQTEDGAAFHSAAPQTFEPDGSGGDGGGLDGSGTIEAEGEDFAIVNFNLLSPSASAVYVCAVSYSHRDLASQISQISCHFIDASDDGRHVRLSIPLASLSPFLYENLYFSVLKVNMIRWFALVECTPLARMFPPPPPPLRPPFPCIHPSLH